jgi:hypothetical protein
MSVTAFWTGDVPLTAFILICMLLAEQIVPIGKQSADVKSSFDVAHTDLELSGM